MNSQGTDIHTDDQSNAVRKVQITKCDCKFKEDKQANNLLRLADEFLDKHQDVIYWTERNKSKNGSFYKYYKGIYKEVSILEIEQMLVDLIPTDPGMKLPSTLSQSQLNETLCVIMRRRFFYREQFNPEGIINFQNGLFSVDEKILTPHTMRIISTNMLPYKYDPTATAPIFMKVLEEATENCKVKQQIIQEFAGYCLSRDTRLEKILFLIGAAGSGKSTVLDGISAMLGEENVSSATIDKLCQPRYTGLFIDKIANIASEIPKDITGYEESLKAIISGEKITIDTKYLPSYDARPYCKLIFAGNDLPAISDSSDGIFRRMLLIYFNNVVHKERIDVDLKENVKKEGAGIFNWALEGYQRLRKNKKFTYSQQMDNELDIVKLQNNTVYYFISENYEVNLEPSNAIPIDELYEHFKDFCAAVGAKGIYKKLVFGKEMRKVFHGKITCGTKYYPSGNKASWLGIAKKNTVVKWEE
jgi:P4 family phage/plasmid primase-like protien